MATPKSGSKKRSRQTPKPPTPLEPSPFPVSKGPKASPPLTPLTDDPTTDSKATAGSDAKPTTPPQPHPIDVNTLTPDETRDRCSRIYELEAAVVSAQEKHDKAKARATTAKNALTEAQVALNNEIREQRMGPGPLFEQN